ncbi:hypothetical protein [Streptomyces gobitricini]|uniref:Uncharacterized protein n=1 Tax=Streptomyces gobitricini TaxID=68211 RepID=A0ABP5Z2W4_9ACTN
MPKFIVTREHHESDPGLAELRGDSARMVPHWVVPAESAPAPVSPSRIHGVVVPPASVRLIDATPEYGV